MLLKQNYNDAVNYLYGLQKHGIKLGLENPRRLMSLLGKPQNFFHSIHITGTNGKGSTATIIASILKESGFRVGLYTSPHLASFTERIRINNLPISETDVVRLTLYIREAIAKVDIKPTFFEFVTAMAFYYFVREKVDWAVVEAGMGGRLDATNVLLPEVSIITNIGLDHKEFLGESISDIAFEKASIIKPTIPVVTATHHPEALEVVGRIAKNCGSKIHIYDKDFKSTLIAMDDKHIIFDYISTSLSPTHTNSYRKYNNLSIPLSGKHQLYNVSSSIRACEILIQKGFHISNDAINKGLLNLNLEGRLEWVSETPPIIIDSAHNPEAAQALANTVKEVFLDFKKIILIIGIMKDKDIEGILKPLLQVSDTIILTKAKGERAAPSEKLKESIKNLEKSDNKNFMSGTVLTTNTVAEAIERAKILWSKNHIILVTGSFYTTGEVKEILGQPCVFSQLRE